MMKMGSYCFKKKRWNQNKYSRSCSTDHLFKRDHSWQKTTLQEIQILSPPLGGLSWKVYYEWEICKAMSAIEEICKCEIWPGFYKFIQILHPCTCLPVLRLLDSQKVYTGIYKLINIAGIASIVLNNML